MSTHPPLWQACKVPHPWALFRDTMVHVHSITGNTKPSVTLAPHCDGLAGSVKFILDMLCTHTFLWLSLHSSLQREEAQYIVTVIHAHVYEIHVDGHQMTDKQIWLQISPSISKCACMCTCMYSVFPHHIQGDIYSFGSR